GYSRHKRSTGFGTFLGCSLREGGGAPSAGLTIEPITTRTHATHPSRTAGPGARAADTLTTSLSILNPCYTRLKPRLSWSETAGERHDGIGRSAFLGRPLLATGAVAFGSLAGSGRAAAPSDQQDVR